MTQTKEIITVTGISNKEEKKDGWVSCLKTNAPSWKTLLIPFKKEILGSVINQLGVYEVSLKNTSNTFGAKPRFEIAEARLIASVDSILKTFK
ncbi:hypothetical protein AB1F57_01010 [Streptococcus sp. ZY1909104]|uniref:ICE protein n=1 Tax=Streptococcus azizii TaxID=1579424 RepID=A0AB36JR60_9STRE|nr:hypothetical protein [Streptococcus azizii]ONK28921.1 hypothetical protein BVE86_02260 [Streptococcus azizii]ONK30432.1 hypothetical protein BVE85_00495 [Streptococcus azizii]ONK31089.1 hypothetical protein BVE84_00815 [Streptococcus azizii]